MTHPTDKELEAMAAKPDRKTHNMIEGHVQMEDAAATLRALSAERDALSSALEKAVLACGEQARARGEAEGKLAASEMAGVVYGWKARAEAAEAERDAALGVLRYIAEEDDAVIYRNEAANAFTRVATKARAFLARHQKETDT